MIIRPKNEKKINIVLEEVRAALAEISTSGKQAKHTVSIEIDCGEKGAVTNGKVRLSTLSKIDM